MLREIDEPEEYFEDSEIFGSPEFKDLKDQMTALQPIRHGVIKKFFQRFKYQRKKREYLLQLIEESEEVTKEILGEDYVHFIEAIPEIKQFLQEVKDKEITTGVQEKKVSIEEDQGGVQTGTSKTKRKDQLKEETVEFDPASFNPFDVSLIKEAETFDKGNRPRKVMTVKKK